MVEGRGGGPTDHATIKQWALSDPEGFQPLIDLLTEAIVQFLGRQIEAGAEAIQLFESWAGILPDPFFERWRSEEHTSELQSLMRSSYAVFCLKKKKKKRDHIESSDTHIRIS